MRMTKSESIIPVYDLGDIYADKSILIDSLAASGTSPTVDAFEKTFGELLSNLPHAVATSSGSSAIVVALWALGIKRGDKVAIPDYTILSVATACLLIGAIPVVIPIEKTTLGMDGEALEACVKQHNVKAVILCHLFGVKNQNSSHVYECAHHNKIHVIDDCSQALIDENFVPIQSGESSVVVSSLYFNKLVTSGEGGVVLTSSQKIAEKAKSFSNLGFGSGEKRFSHENSGFNFRISGLAAQLGSFSLSIIDQVIEKKIEIKNKYNEYLCNRTLPALNEGEVLLWMYPFIINTEDEKRVFLKLTNEKIQVRSFYTPISRQAVLAEDIISLVPPKFDYGYVAHSFYIPSGLGLDSDKISFISNILK